MKTACFAVLAIVSIFVSNLYGETIATFADPALNSSTPLFSVNNVTKTITGGWNDTQTGLDIQLVYTGNFFEDAFFTMTPLAYTGSLAYAATGSGTIKFYADNVNPNSDMPIFQIDFASATITFAGLGGDNVFSGNDVVFSGSELVGQTLSEEVFAFSFANLKALNPAAPTAGYSATAAFTSSAVTPEPATLIILALGSLMLRNKKR